MTGLSWNLQVSFSPAACWHIKQVRLCSRSWQALRRNLLNLLPERKEKNELDAIETFTTINFAQSGFSPGRSRHDVVKVGSLKAVEGGGCGDSVSAHILKNHPVAHLHVGQVTLLHDPVQSITCGTPDTAGVHYLIWLWLLLGKKKKKGG